MSWTKSTQKELKTEVESRDNLAPFVFTYGSNDSYPYQGGWCIIYAKNRTEACDIHKDKYGLYKNEYLGNFAFCYSIEEFEKTEMCKSGNLGNYCHAVHNYRRVQSMIEERAKMVIEAVINDNQVSGLIDGVEAILYLSGTTPPDELHEDVSRLLDRLKEDLDYWVTKDSDCIDDLEELVYIQRKVDTVQVYYDHMDEIGDVRECSIRDLKGEIIYFAGW